MLSAEFPNSSRPPDPPVDGDAATDFTSSTVWQLEGLVVRRVKVLARDPLLAGHVDSTTVQRRWGRTGGRGAETAVYLAPQWLAEGA